MALYRVGSRGNAVRQLQRNLNTLGITVGGNQLKADGIFGNRTRTAVRNLQRRNNLSVDGLAGNKTLSTINSLLKSRNNKSSTSNRSSSTSTKKKSSSSSASKKPSFIQETSNAGYTGNALQLPNQRADLNTILEQSQNMLNPLIQQRKDTTQSSFNSEMQQLGNQWASRGLLASGVAATQENQAAQALASQLATIDAEGQAEALENAYNLGNLQENQRQFDMSYALQEGELTGNYLPSGTRDLIAQLVAERQIVEDKNTNNADRKRATQRINDIRAVLNTMGVATNNIGRGSSLQQILNAMASDSVGSETLQSRQLGIENQLARDQFGLDKQRVGLEGRRVDLEGRRVDLAEQQQNWAQGFEERVQSFKEKQASIDNRLRQAGLDIDRAKVELQSLANQSDIDYQNHLINMGLSEERARNATNSAIASALSHSSFEGAYEFIMKNVDNFSRNGVDVGAVQDAIDRKWGGLYAPSTQDEPDPFANP